MAVSLVFGLSGISWTCFAPFAYPFPSSGFAWAYVAIGCSVQRGFGFGIPSLCRPILSTATPSLAAPPLLLLMDFSWIAGL